MSRHIIHKQKVTLQLPKGADAHFFQNCVSDLLHNQLHEQLETLLDGLFPSDKIIRIDSLQLDLGSLNPRNFEQEFKDEFIKALTKSLAAKQDILNTTNDEEVLSGTQSLVHTFIYFLQKGYLPWYHIADKKTELEQELLVNFSAKEYDYVLDWLRDNYQHDPVIVKRLVRQFSDALLGKLFSAVRPSVNNEEDFVLVCKDYEYLLKVYLKMRPGRDEIQEHVFYALLNNALLNNKDSAWAFRALRSLKDYFNIKTALIAAINEREIATGIKTKIVREAVKDFKVFLKKNEPVKQDSPKAKRKADHVETPDDQLYDNGKELTVGWSRDKKEKWQAEEDTLYVNNSGVVILHHFLKPFFEGLKLLADGKFINDTAHQRAVLLLYYLATGDVKVPEFDLPLQKILCGYPLENTLPVSIKLSRKEKAESEKLLKTVIDYWPPLKGTSVEGLRSTFFQRDGKLLTTENGWLLTVEQKTVDILLGKLPWGFSTIRLPWMEQILNVDWY